MSNRDPHFYDTSIEWQGTRRGSASSPGLPNLPFSTPPEFNGEPGFWTPEHFFVLATETCLMATFVAIAELSKVPVQVYSSSAKGKLEWIDGQGWKFTEVEVRPVIVLANEADREKALRVLEKAEKGCLIARSISAQVSVLPEIRVLQPA